MGREDYARLDVGKLYLMMHVADQKGLGRIKQAGIDLGHVGVIDRASELLGTQPSREELSDALKNAIGMRGFSIDNPDTSVGGLFQQLYGDTDINNIYDQILSDQVKIADRDGTPILYNGIPEKRKEEIRNGFKKKIDTETRNNINIGILVDKGFKDTLIEKGYIQVEQEIEDNK